MKKNRFKKLSILALSTVCLLTNQANGMDKPETALGQSGLGRSSLNMSQLEQSLVSELSQLTEEQMMTMSQLMSSIKQGGLSTSHFDTTDIIYKQEFEKLNDSGNLFLWPTKTHPGKMCDAFGKLFAIHDSALRFFEMENDSSVFKNLCHNLDKESAVEFTKFLINTEAENLELISNPSYMIMFLKMLKPLNFQPCMELALQLTNNDWHACNAFEHLISGHSSSPIFINSVGIKSGSFFVKMTSLYKNLINSFQHMYLGNVGDANQQQAVKEKIQNSLKDQFNQIFTVGGKQCFDIVKDGDLINRQFSKWLNILSVLPKYTVQSWEQKGPLLEQFQNQVEWANKTLDASLTNKKMYSGVSVSPYTVSLTQTNKQDKSEEHDFLKGVVKEHQESHKDEISAYNNVKDELPMLKKAIKLFDNFADILSKKGKMS
jgi:hypothetical protein